MTSQNQNITVKVSDSGPAGREVVPVKPGRERASSSDRHSAKSGNVNNVNNEIFNERICPMCNIVFKSKRGVSNHKRFCKADTAGSVGEKTADVILPSEKVNEHLGSENSIVPSEINFDCQVVIEKIPVIPVRDEVGCIVQGKSYSLYPRIDRAGCFPVKNKAGLIVQGVQCSKCKQVVTTSNRLQVHKRNHPECSDYTDKCPVCSRPFKNEHGIIGHLAQSDCGTDFSKQDSHLSQGVSSDVAESLTGSEENHIATSRYDLDEERRLLEAIPIKDAIKWPPMKCNKEWMQFDSVVVDQLDRNGSIDQRINRLELIVYEEGKRCFGCAQKKQGRAAGPSREEKSLGCLRKELKNLQKLMKQCSSEEESAGYLVVIVELSSKIKDLRRKVNGRKRRWRRKMARKKFVNDPFRAAKEVLSPKDRTALKVKKEIIDAYVEDVASDPKRSVNLGKLDDLPDFQAPKTKFKETTFTFSEFQAVIKRTRNASSPGPNKIPYKVYKKCKSLANYLFDIIKSAITADKAPLKWRITDGIFIPKVDKPEISNIKDYRQIALLNVEGKIFWSLVSNRLYKYLVDDNEIIKTSIQKGSIRGMAGCWEHTTMVWSALRDAKLNSKSLVSLWLDLENAYGSIPHKLIEFALRRYKVPERWIELLLGYYDGLWGRSSSSGVSSEWTNYQKGIFAGCTVSVILFLVAFNVILEFVDAGGVQRYALKERRIEVLRGFMDDVSILTTSVVQAKRALERTERALQWARMKLKPPKSRSLVIKTGLVQKIEPFNVSGTTIPGLHNKTLKTLGRVFDCSITDRAAKELLLSKFESSLTKIDKSLFTGFMKTWTLNHILIPQIQWDIMIYDVPLKLVELLERKQSVFIRKWLGLAKHLSDVALFSNDVPIPLPVKSLVGIFKSTKVGSFLQLKYSRDEEVAEICSPSGGKKWDVKSAIESAESRLRVDAIAGDVRGGDQSEASSRAGLGYIPSSVKQYEQGSKEHRRQIIDKVKEAHNETLTVKAIRQGVQGMWTQWTNYIKRDVTWKYAFTDDSKLLRFCVGVTYNTKATPNNLATWGLQADPKCNLCQQDGCGIRHILSGCPVSLKQGRFTYRHNQVLRKIAHGIQSFIQTNHVVSHGIKPIHFVAENGTTVAKKRWKPQFGILHQAADFKLEADLEKKLKYPQHIADFGGRPDIVIYSNIAKVVIHLELTVPCEERFADSNSIKEARYGQYSELWSKCVEKGWKVFSLPVEVGARGYAANSLRFCLSKLGIGRGKAKTILKEASDEALRCSFWIWIHRNNVEWSLSTGFRKK